MAYRIQYNRDMMKKYPEKRKKRTGKGVAVLMLAAIVISAALWNKGELVRRLFVPGDSVQTGEAVSDLVDDIREGESVKDAFVAFCLEIIKHAQR